MRTLRERLAANVFVVGQRVTVKDTDGRVDFRGMTGEIRSINQGFAFVKLSAWGTTHVVALQDLARVERAA